MIKGGRGGGRTITGLHFEKRSDLAAVFLTIPGYSITGNDLFFRGKKVASLYPKNKLYKQFLEPRGVDSKKILSKKLLPDNAVYVYAHKTLFIVELKFQETPGSVDEKLQTCDFKNKQYHKLLKKIGADVKYIYVLSDWFKKDEYKDVREYIENVGCKYFFNILPIEFLGLPKPQ